MFEYISYNRISDDSVLNMSHSFKIVNSYSDDASVEQSLQSLRRLLRRLLLC